MGKLLRALVEIMFVLVWFRFNIDGYIQFWITKETLYLGRKYVWNVFLYWLLAEMVHNVCTTHSYYKSYSNMVHRKRAFFRLFFSRKLIGVNSSENKPHGVLNKYSKFLYAKRVCVSWFICDMFLRVSIRKRKERNWMQVYRNTKLS